MRALDLSRMSATYDVVAAPGELRVAEILGVAVPSVRSLEQAILADFVTEAPYGIGWWAPSPGTSRRILIADQLYACVHSLADNLIEAALHHLELREALDAYSTWVSESVRLEMGEPDVRSPEMWCPMDEVRMEAIRIHVAGVSRAVAGALDCLAGAAIGVVGLPLSVLYADFDRLRKLFGNPTRLAAGQRGRQVQIDFGAKLEAVIADSGPDGWLEWTLGLRNMLVHRGRRRDAGMLVPTGPPRPGRDGGVVLPVAFEFHLPRDPGRSEVEVLLDPSNQFVLEESCETTLDGVIGSTTKLADEVAKELLTIWQLRKNAPDLLLQPSSQWSGGVNKKALPFVGYAPGSAIFNPTEVRTSSADWKRITAAALDDGARGQWAEFD